MAAAIEKKDDSSPLTQDMARVCFDFNKGSLAKLDEIVSADNASTRSELIRRALTLYAEVIEAENRGAKICFRESDGTFIQVLLLF